MLEGRSSRWKAIATWGAVLAACSSSGTAPAELAADVARLSAALAADPAEPILDDVDRAVQSERPVMAAELIRQSALGRVDRQIDTLSDLPIGTPEGRQLRSRAVRIFRARAAALTLYADALARGIGTEDMQLLDALDAYGDAERDLAALTAELDRMLPAAHDAPEDPDREAALGGLPPIAREDLPLPAPEGVREHEDRRSEREE